MYFMNNIMFIYLFSFLNIYHKIEIEFSLYFNNQQIITQTNETMIGQLSC